MTCNEELLKELDKKIEEEFHFVDPDTMEVIKVQLGADTNLRPIDHLEWTGLYEIYSFSGFGNIRLLYIIDEATPYFRENGRLTYSTYHVPFRHDLAYLTSENKKDVVFPDSWGGWDQAKLFYRRPPPEEKDFDPKIINEVTAAVRASDDLFEKTGGTSRHWVRECFLPFLEERGLEIAEKEKGDQ
jgi:hypothetical protein